MQGSQGPAQGNATAPGARQAGSHRHPEAAGAGHPPHHDHGQGQEHHQPRVPPRQAAEPASPRPAAGWLATLRNQAGAHVRALTRSNSGLSLDYDNPPGDPGLFGPDAVCWRVHGDFPAMLAGGVSALLLQTLHPLALAGVSDHSTFRTDMQGRLGRTAQFIAGTTYGNRADALALIERVKRIHLGVTGVAPDGRPYAASDPALLTWVHVAEVSSFLAGYLRFVGPLPEHEQDRYYDEVAHIAELLGAADVPHSRAAVAAYLEAMRPQLVVTDSTLEVVRLVMTMRVGNPMFVPAVRVMGDAGVALLPSWARAALGLSGAAALRLPVSLAAMRMLAPALRWSLGSGLAARARRRAAATPPG